MQSKGSAYSLGGSTVRKTSNTPGSNGTVTSSNSTESSSTDLKRGLAVVV